MKQLKNLWLSLKINIVANEISLNIERKRLLLENHNLRVKIIDLELINKTQAKQLILSGVSCSLPTKNDAIIKKHELLKEAESELSESDFKRTMIKGIEFGFERYHDWLMANYR
jgi:hypothetical protein